MKGNKYLQEQLLEAQKKEHVLQNQLSQLTEENQKLLGQLAERKSKEDFCASDTIPTSGTWHPEKDDTFACGDKTGNVSLVNLKNPNSAQTSAVHSQSITGLAYSFHMYHLYFAFFSVCVVIL
ncbi:methylosome protein 50-like [Xenopus laevis]|uniref:Methylosome protein 50-like n=1 Tax=Xenopus laevis TaxID=8355 RepID=A0A8J1M9Q7_XENLA|nr:methylosome protein 50-like [Xenopus laevis]XP_041437795.1 methylosome protein 50-like [Xenopus laevis]